MIENKKILAICPARGGSKGIPLKNLIPFLGIPLVARVGNLVSEISMIDRAIVSTDHPEIAEVARQSGLDAPFFRPEALSGDQISDAQVLIHALKEMERLDKVQYDIVIMLQPTSPLRRKEQVVQAIEMLIQGHWDAVWTVSESDSKHHPLKQLKVEADQLSYYDPDGHQIIARQQLTPLYHRNGVAYVITRNCLLDHKNITGKRTGALILSEYYVSIDTMWDLQLSEFIYHHYQALNT
ncbi:MAG: acylneuraminate cytidylyltransferase family protein [Nitrospirae bacterium]|nr:acylneuraminate cytidylyltransferase family protein [Nitrospirota bacterium]